MQIHSRKQLTLCMLEQHILALFWKIALFEVEILLKCYSQWFRLQLIPNVFLQCGFMIKMSLQLANKAPLIYSHVKNKTFFFTFCILFSLGLSVLWISIFQTNCFYILFSFHTFAFNNKYTFAVCNSMYNYTGYPLALHQS